MAFDPNALQKGDQLFFVDCFCSFIFYSIYFNIAFWISIYFCWLNDCLTIFLHFMWLLFLATPKKISRCLDPFSSNFMERWSGQRMVARLARTNLRSILVREFSGKGLWKTPYQFKHVDTSSSLHFFFVFRVWGFSFKLPKSITSLNLQKMAGVCEDSLSFFLRGVLTKSYKIMGITRPPPHPPK